MTSDQFNLLVYRLAQGDGGPDWRRVVMVDLIQYLKANFTEVKDTTEGRFLREFPEWNPCPDYSLRTLYREQILNTKEHK